MEPDAAAATTAPPAAPRAQQQQQQRQQQQYDPALACKRIPGTPFAVDCFRRGAGAAAALPGVTAYFLTHAHSDHYGGLSEAWSAGPVYCSETTAALAHHLTGVGHEWLRPLPMNTPCDVEGG